MAISGAPHADFRLLKLPRTARYAIQGMARLAQGMGFVLAKSAARADALPPNFLAKVFQRLAKAGLLVSRRGRGGGYALARPAERIRLAEIVAAASEPILRPHECILSGRLCGERPCAVHAEVLAADHAVLGALELLRLSSLLPGAAGDGKPRSTRR